MKIFLILISILLANTSIAGSDMEDSAYARAFLACGGFSGWLISTEPNGQKVIFTFECSGQKRVVEIECGSGKFSCRQLR